MNDFYKEFKKIYFYLYHALKVHDKLLFKKKENIRKIQMPLKELKQTKPFL